MHDSHDSASFELLIVKIRQQLFMSMRTSEKYKSKVIFHPFSEKSPVNGFSLNFTCGVDP